MFKKLLFSICILFLYVASKSQAIVNLILVGKNGITENVKEAKSFIVVKQFGTSLQRLDYEIHAPLVKERNYSDSNMTILHGNYFEYDESGALKISGEYEENLKSNTWYFYNDTGKIILEQQYQKGILLKTINPDTIKKSIDTLEYKDEVDASFGKKKDDWIKYLSKNLDGNVASNSVKGGKVRVCFQVNTLGECKEIYLRKSVEFVLDEEAKRIIQKSPNWNPAFQNGKHVNSYRLQPISFEKL
jgi:antitoxin component YwqK of YwqJK toxin-antitoxin module